MHWLAALTTTAYAMRRYEEEGPPLFAPIRLSELGAGYFHRAFMPRGDARRGVSRTSLLA